MSDLLLDSRLNTTFLPDGSTRHRYVAMSGIAGVRGEIVEDTWRRRRNIGMGGFGMVWAEVCESGPLKGSVRAVKQISKTEGHNSWRSILGNEAEAMAKFSHARYAHCFVQSHGWYEDETTTFIAMEYMHLGDLQMYLSQPLPEAEAMVIVRQVIEAVSYMHENGFVHRDVKAPNIFVYRGSPEWWVKLGDFGVSKRLHGTGFQTFVGTLLYIPPEMQGFTPSDDSTEKPFTSAVDIWAVGILTFRMISGHFPFPQPRNAFEYVTGSKSFPRETLEASGASPECCEFIEWVLAEAPGNRPTAQEAAVHTWIRYPDPTEVNNQFPAEMGTVPELKSLISRPRAESQSTADWATWSMKTGPLGDPVSNSSSMNSPTRSNPQSTNHSIIRSISPAASPDPTKSSVAESPASPSEQSSGSGVIADELIPAAGEFDPLSSGISTSIPDRPYQRDASPQTLQRTPTHLSSVVLEEALYIYRFIESTQVRLLMLEKGRPSNEISCVIQAFFLGEENLKESLPKYQALSYSWGKEAATVEICLRDADNLSEGHRLGEPPRRPILIRGNIYNALKCLRSEDQDQWFWIDALCINQTDDIEKSHQLPKMLEIYRRAWNVCIWLGEPDIEWTNKTVCDHPLDFSANIINLPILDRMVSEMEPDQHRLRSWIEFAKLIKRSWFTRRWVIQEITAAHRASIHCGTRCQDWRDFAVAIELFMTKLDAIRALFERTHRQKDLAVFSHLECASAGAIVDATNHLLRKSDDGSILDRGLNAESLVVMFRYFAATDPRDTIYALLPLARDGPMATPSASQGPHLLIPDYTKSTLQTYAYFVKHCFSSAASLDIICRDWALSPHSPQSGGLTLGLDNGLSLPSWIRVIKSPSFSFQGLRSNRREQDSLVGQPGQRIYNASRGMVAQCRLTDAKRRLRRPVPNAERVGNLPENEAAGRSIMLTLFAQGIVLDTITRLSEQIADSAIPTEGLRMAGWDRSNKINNLSERVWRTLVADRATNGGRTLFWFRVSCMYSLGKTTPDGALDMSRLLADKMLPDTVKSYLRRVQAVFWGRRFFECQKETLGRASVSGLGPGGMQNGDLVCILFGCSVPVVLRQITDASGRYYESIGECYVHGYMDGEALAGLDQLAILESTVEFNLR